MQWLICFICCWSLVNEIQAETIDLALTTPPVSLTLSSPLQDNEKVGMVSVFITIEENHGGIYLQNCLSSLEEFFPYSDFYLETFLLISGDIGYRKRHILKSALNKHGNVVIIRHESLCMAYNEALRSASGDYILMLSDHVELRERHVIKRLVSHLNEYGGLVGGKLVYMTDVVRDVGIDFILAHSRGLESVPRPYLRFSGIRKHDVRTSEASRVLGVSRAFAMIHIQELKALANVFNRSEICLFDCEHFQDGPVHLDLDLALSLKFKLQRDVWWFPQAEALVHGSDEEMDIGLFDYSAAGSREFDTRWGSLLRPLIAARWQIQDVRLVWSTECGVGEVLGFTTEAMNFVTALESRLPSVRVETGDRHGCLKDLLQAGFPSYSRASMKRMLEMEQPRNNSMTTVLVIHRDAGRFPSFLRSSFGVSDESLVAVGRSMFETDKIEDNWVRNSNREDIREVWVPSHFNVETFANAGVQRNKLRVVGECVDIFHYDPATTAPLNLQELAIPPLPLPFSSAATTTTSSISSTRNKPLSVLFPPYSSFTATYKSSSSSLTSSRSLSSLSSSFSSSSSSSFSSLSSISTSSSSSATSLFSLAPHIPSLAASSDSSSSALLSSSTTFRVLSIGKWEVRKGWLTLLEAYYEAFTGVDDVVLLVRAHLAADKLAEVADFRASYLKKRNKRALSGCADCDKAQMMKESELPRIVYLQDIVPFADLPALYKSVNCFVLPSHGEGWGLPLLEAMRMGVPTLATNFSGNMEFMNAHNSYLVQVGAMVSHPSLSDHRWAEASVPHMRHLLRCLYQQHRHGKGDEVCDDVPDSKLITQQAIKDVARWWSQDALAKSIVAHLDRLRREMVLKVAENRRHKIDESDFKQGWQKTVYHEVVEYHHSPGRLNIRVND